MLGDDGVSPLVKKLFQACTDGEPKVIQEILDQNVDVNVCGESKRTPLHLACFRKKLACVSFLLENGADVNPLDMNNCSPLHLCFSPVESSDTFNICELLLSFGADVNAVSVSNETPGHYAVKSGFFKSLSLMVDMNCDINIMNNDQQNLSDFARIFRQKEIGKYLENLKSKEMSQRTFPKRLPSDANSDGESESEEESSEENIATPTNLSLTLGKEEAEEEEDYDASESTVTSVRTNPMTPDEEIADVYIHETRNVKQSYKLFKTLVDEQFEGNLDEDDELLLDELVQMGFEHNTLSESTPFQEAIVKHFMTPPVQDGEETENNKPVAIEKPRLNLKNIEEESPTTGTSDFETNSTSNSTASTPRFETHSLSGSDRLAKEARLRQLLAENESLKEVVKNYQELLEQITHDTTSAL